MLPILCPGRVPTAHSHGNLPRPHRSSTVNGVHSAPRYGTWAGHRHVGLNLPALARARELVFLAEGEAGRDVAVPAGRLRHPRASIFAPA